MEFYYGSTSRASIGIDSSYNIIHQAATSHQFFDKLGHQLAVFKYSATQNLQLIVGGISFSTGGSDLMWSDGREIRESSTGFEIDGNLWPAGDRDNSLGGDASEWKHTYTWQLHVSNNAWADNWYTNSDIKVKKNIKQIESTTVINNLLKIQGVEFDYKRNNKHSIGLIAQNVEEVYPEMVSEVERVVDDGKEEMIKDENGIEQKKVVGKKWEKIKTVNYTSLIPVIIEAIREQQKQINELKNALNKPKNDAKN